MKNKFRLGKDALNLSILTLITALTWIGFDVYRALTKTEIPRILQEQIAPLNPEIDWETLSSLKMRQVIGQEELEKVVAPEPTTSPLPSPSPEATPEATPEEEATESGNETI